MDLGAFKLWSVWTGREEVGFCLDSTQEADVGIPAVGTFIVQSG